MSSNTVKMPSSSQVEAFKKEHGQIHRITVGDSFCIVRHPKIVDVSMATAFSTQKDGTVDEYISGKTYLENCWLMGDESIKTDVSKIKEAGKVMNRLFQKLPYSLDEQIVDGKFLNSVDDKTRALLSKEKVIKVLSVVVSDEEIKVGYFRIPDEVIRDMAMANSDFLVKGQVYAEKCFIAGDDEILNGSEEVKFITYIACHSLYRHFEVKVEKL